MILLLLPQLKPSIETCSLMKANTYCSSKDIRCSVTGVWRFLVTSFQFATKIFRVCSVISLDLPTSLIYRPSLRYLMRTGREINDVRRSSEITEQTVSKPAEGPRITFTTSRSLKSRTYGHSSFRLTVRKTPVWLMICRDLENGRSRLCCLRLLLPLHPDLSL